MELGNICKDFSVKSVTTKNTLISGYASVFDFVDHQNDLVEKGAFENVLAQKTKLLWQHDYSKPIGTIKRIFEDNYGLKVEAEINNDVHYGKEAASLIKQKAIEGLSVGFHLEEFNFNDKGVRIIKKAKLLEVSIVTFPANSKAGIMEVKSLNNKVNNSPTSLDRLNYLLKELVILTKN